MGNTFNESFSCPIKKVAIITQAKDRAKQLGKSWSEYIVDLIQADTKKQSQQEQQRNGTVISILNNGQQLCITEFTPRLYQNDVERKQQQKWIQSIDNEELTDFAHKVNDTKGMIQIRRNNENREAREKVKFRRMNTPIRGLDKIGLSNNNFDTMKLNLNPTMTKGDEDIPDAKDDGYE